METCKQNTPAYIASLHVLFGANNILSVLTSLYKKGREGKGEEGRIMKPMVSFQTISWTGYLNWALCSCLIKWNVNIWVLPFFIADLIMLGLATHEPNFTIIREEFKPNKPRPCGLCNQFGHEVKDCQGLPKEKQGEVSWSLCLNIFCMNHVVCRCIKWESSVQILPQSRDLQHGIG